MARPADDIASLDLPAATRELLERHHFDAETFFRLRADLLGGLFTAERNRVTEPVAPPEPNDLTPWPTGKEADELATAGRDLLESGAVGVVVLNGGMATRFGGGVKGVVEVVEGRSFLGIRLSNIAAFGAKAPAFLMSSFATDEQTREHLTANDYFGLSHDRVFQMTQRVSLRIRADGELYLDPNGLPSPYAPGHGDIFEVLAENPGFRRFVDGGGKCVMIGNVDNIGATVSPVVIGAHLRGGKPATVEVAPREGGDKGGAPVRIRDRVEILEHFRFPAELDINRVPVFNTNTLVLDVDAIRSDYDLTWFRADKEINGEPVVQFERLMGEVTSFVDATYLRVPREGAEDRFMPVKTPTDLEAVRERVRERIARWCATEATL